MWTPPAKATSTTARQTVQDPPASGASADADIFDLFGPSPGVDTQQSRAGRLSNGRTSSSHEARATSSASLDPFATALSHGHGKANSPIYAQMKAMRWLQYLKELLVYMSPR
jgi:hypothetical protein